MPHHTKRIVTRALIAVAATVGIVFAQAAPASATVHEIVASGAPVRKNSPTRDLRRKQTDNFAEPLIASGFVTGDLVPFTGTQGLGCSSSSITTFRT